MSRLRVLAAPLVLLLPAVAAAGVLAEQGPNDEAYAAQSLGGVSWDTGALGVRFLSRPPWMHGLTGRGVRVGLVDTGIDAGHPDLRGKVVAWRDFLSGREAPYDDDDHGTHIAGIVAASNHWQLNPGHHYFPRGARGLAPGVELLVAKAMNQKGEGTTESVASAIEWIVDPDGDGDPRDGADVINLSIGIELPSKRTVPAIPGLEAAAGPDPCSRPGLFPDRGIVRICEAIGRAVGMGVPVVVAAGNHQAGEGDAITFPGTMGKVITVGAATASGKVAAFSNRGDESNRKPDLLAPGVIVSTFPRARDLTDGRQDGYLGLGGTSMAAPVVTATVALMMEAAPELRGKSAAGGLEAKVARIKSVLLLEASHPGEWDPGSGFGMVDTEAAVERVDAGRATGVRYGFVLGVLGLAGLASWRVTRRRKARRRRPAAARVAVLASRRPARVEAPVLLHEETVPAAPRAKPRPKTRRTRRRATRRAAGAR